MLGDIALGLLFDAHVGVGSFGVSISRQSWPLGFAAQAQRLGGTSSGYGRGHGGLQCVAMEDGKGGLRGGLGGWEAGGKAAVGAAARWWSGDGGLTVECDSGRPAQYAHWAKSRPVRIILDLKVS